MPRHHLALRHVLAIPVAAVTLAACGGDDDATDRSTAAATSSDAADVTIAVSDAWSRQPAAGQTVAAVYGVVTNDSDADVTVVAASSPVSDRVELHETVEDDDGAMVMREREGGFVVPAGGEFAFESGGPHIMLFDIDPSTYPDTVQVTLELDGADPITFDAEVRSIGGTDDMDMSSDAMSSDAMPSGDESTMDMSSGEIGHDSADGSDHDHGTASDDAAHEHDAIDPQPLHELDEQLADGTLDLDAQRAVVAGYIEQVEAMDPVDGSPEAELLAVLHDLDAALVAGDVTTASDLALEAHELAHDLEPHD